MRLIEHVDKALALVEQMRIEHVLGQEVKFSQAYASAVKILGRVMEKIDKQKGL